MRKLLVQRRIIIKLPFPLQLCVIVNDKYYKNKRQEKMYFCIVEEEAEDEKATKSREKYRNFQIQ